MSKSLIAAGIVLGALPLSGIATVLLAPFWNWFETSFGIEAIGHSAPSGWCFVATYLLALLAGFGVWALTPSIRDGV